MNEIFSASSRVALFCRFEAELAAAQAALNLVPGPAAAAIGVACARPVADPAAVLQKGWEVGTPLIPLLEELRGRLDEESARWLHQGTTTQDVVDTALVLQMKQGLDVIDRGVREVTASLAQVADLHRTTPMMASSFLQAAVPTTFGAKAALWLAPLVRLRAEVAEAALRLPLQLGGPVGDLAPFGAAGSELTARLAEALGLVAPAAPWHTDRSPVTAVIGLVERIVAAVEKIAIDVALLAQSGVDEIRVPAGGSSSMPDKRNPVDSLAALAAAQVCHAMAAGLTGARAHERERAVGTWHAEWAMVPIVFQTAAASVAAISRGLTGLEVNAETMSEHAGAAAVDTSHLIDAVLATYHSGVSS